MLSESAINCYISLHGISSILCCVDLIYLLPKLYHIIYHVCLCSSFNFVLISTFACYNCFWSCFWYRFLEMFIVPARVWHRVIASSKILSTQRYTFWFVKRSFLPVLIKNYVILGYFILIWRNSEFWGQKFLNLVPIKKW